MFRFVLASSVFAISVLSSAAQSSTTSADVQAALSRAEALYYEARFQESIQLLTPLDVALVNQRDRLRESIAVKLQLALSYVGLDELPAAKTRFAELCSLDPEYELDPMLFAPKILELFSEARGDQTKTRCSVVCDQANRLLNENRLEPLLDLLIAAPKGCACLQDVAKKAAELSFRQGLEAFKQDDFEPAEQSFKMALAFDPQHNVAAQYIELTDMKFKLEVDRLVLDWRTNFEGRKFPQAASAYLQLASPNLAQKARPALDQIRGEYRKSASSLADAWRQKCAADPRALPDETLRQTRGMLPEATIAQDIIEQIKPCAPPPPAQPLPCIQALSQIAMVRLKSRVSPEVPRAARPVAPVRILVKIRIDKTGNVVVNDIHSPNAFYEEPVKVAVEQWKFFPAIVDSQPRCVETELPIVLTPTP